MGDREALGPADVTDAELAAMVADLLHVDAVELLGTSVEPVDYHLPAITTGGLEEAYAPEGFNRYTVRQLLAPVDQTAHLCGMTLLPPFVTHGSHKLTDAQIAAQAADYRHLVTALRDGRVDPEVVAAMPRINLDLATACGEDRDER